MIASPAASRAASRTRSRNEAPPGEVPAGTPATLGGATSVAAARPGEGWGARGRRPWGRSSVTADPRGGRDPSSTLAVATQPRGARTPQAETAHPTGEACDGKTLDWLSVPPGLRRRVRWHRPRVAGSPLPGTRRIVQPVAEL